MSRQPQRICKSGKPLLENKLSRAPRSSDKCLRSDEANAYENNKKKVFALQLGNQRK